jgi:hypothetical protein
MSCAACEAQHLRTAQWFELGIRLWCDIDSWVISMGAHQYAGGRPRPWDTMEQIA